MPGRYALPQLPRRPRPIRPARGPASQLQEDQAGEPPDWFTGTRPEWRVYWALLRLGKVPGRDFIYQARQLGGRQDRGGQVLDFEMLDPPGLALNVSGLFWHYGRGSAKLAEDALERAALASLGYTVIILDEDDLARSPVYYVSEALRGVDHSRISKGYS